MIAAVVLGLLLAAALNGADAPNTLLDQGYHNMYNLDFAGAHRCFQEWGKQHPDDPMGPISEGAAYLYSEFDRLRVLQSEFFTEDDSFFKRQRELRPDPSVKGQFDGAVTRGQKLAGATLAKKPDDENAMLASVLGVGLRADYLAMIEKRNGAALTELKSSRAMAEQLLSKHPSCYDAYLAVGVENYMLSLKAAPLRWFLQMTGAQTDKQLGIERLRITAEKGRFLLPYARLLLGVAALRDKDKATAVRTLEWLSNRYPQNRLYREELAKLKR
ncbi:MAG: hypothetical protein JSU00_16185 [Acidobacteria bacterium]|nr:hypothetical protein [Acidobacteriota bacterium]